MALHDTMRRLGAAVTAAATLAVGSSHANDLSGATLPAAPKDFTVSKNTPSLEKIMGALSKIPGQVDRTLRVANAESIVIAIGEHHLEPPDYLKLLQDLRAAGVEVRGLFREHAQVTQTPSGDKYEALKSELANGGSLARESQAIESAGFEVIGLESPDLLKIAFVAHETSILPLFLDLANAGTGKGIKVDKVHQAQEHLDALPDRFKPHTFDFAREMLALKDPISELLTDKSPNSLRNRIDAWAHSVVLTERSKAFARNATSVLQRQPGVYLLQAGKAHLKTPEDQVKFFKNTRADDPINQVPLIDMLSSLSKGANASIITFSPDLESYRSPYQSKTD